MSSDTVEPGPESRARGFMRKRDFAAAIDLLQEAHGQDPADGDIAELLGMAQFMNKQHQEARETFERLTRQDPLRTNAWVNLGAVLNRLDQPKLAADALRRALQRDRRCAIAYYNLGIAQRAMKQNTMAISAYKEAVKLQPDLCDAHLNLGKLYLEMKNFGLAQQHFNAVLKHDPECSKARLLLEKLHDQQKSSRRSESPFGRLVDEKTLAAAQQVTKARTLDAHARNDERELMRKLAREARSGVKQMVPLLDESLQSSLQRLAVFSLQSDNRSADPSVMTTLISTRAELIQLHAHVIETCGRLRDHLNGVSPAPTSPGDSGENDEDDDN